jgi:hypothetical protein
MEPGQTTDERGSNRDEAVTPDNYFLMRTFWIQTDLLE